MRWLAGLGLTALLPFAAACQTKPAFDIADIHSTPRGEWVKRQIYPVQGGYLAGERYELHPQYCVAALTLLGSLASLCAQYQSGTLQGGPKSLAQVHEQLIDSRFDALQTKQEIEQIGQKEGEVAAKRKLVKHANTICSVIRRMESRVI